MQSNWKRHFHCIFLEYSIWKTKSMGFRKYINVCVMLFSECACSLPPRYTHTSTQLVDENNNNLHWKPCDSVVSNLSHTIPYDVKFFQENTAFSLQFSSNYLRFVLQNTKLTDYRYQVSPWSVCVISYSANTLEESSDHFAEQLTKRLSSTFHN